jgi:hypothetical protein
MAARDQRKKAVGLAIGVNKGVIVISKAPLFQCPHNPRIEAVIARAICNIRNSWQKLSVQVDTGCLYGKVVQSADLFGWFHPSCFLLLSKMLRFSFQAEK